jgi:hypothetical protein
MRYKIASVALAVALMPSAAMAGERQVTLQWVPCRAPWYLGRSGPGVGRSSAIRPVHQFHILGACTARTRGAKYAELLAIADRCPINLRPKIKLPLRRLPQRGRPTPQRLLARRQSSRWSERIVIDGRGASVPRSVFLDWINANELGGRHALVFCTRSNAWCVRFFTLIQCGDLPPR